MFWSNKRKCLFAFFTFFVCFSGCGEKTTPVQNSQNEIPFCKPKLGVYARGDTLYYCGLIDLAGVERIKGLLSAEHKSIVIGAYGWDPSHSINLAKLIVEEDLQPIFSGLCMWTCAHFLFVPLRNAEYSENTVIGFGYTQSLFANLRSIDGIPSFQMVEDMASAEQEFYSSMGIAKELLFQPFLNNLPTYVGIDIDPTIFQPTSQVVGLDIPFVIPPYEVISAIVSDVKFEDWPQDDLDLNSRLKRLGAAKTVKLNHDWKVLPPDVNITTCLGSSTRTENQSKFETVFDVSFEPDSCVAIPLSIYLD